MALFLARRLLQAVPLRLVISLVVFLLIHAAPGGPLAIYLSNPNVRPQDIERLRRALGLDQPLWRQYVSWLSAFAVGVFTAVTRGRLVDRVTTAAAAAGIALPAFWFGLMLQIVFATGLGWL